MSIIAIKPVEWCNGPWRFHTVCGLTRMIGQINQLVFLRIEKARVSHLNPFWLDLVIIVFIPVDHRFYDRCTLLVLYQNSKKRIKTFYQ